MTLAQELKALQKMEIAVAMDDGQSYRGRLKKFDEGTMVLEDVFETTSQKIDWIETKDVSGAITAIKGYIPWRRVTLPKVIIRNETVLRIWPWSSAGTVDDVPKEIDRNSDIGKIPVKRPVKKSV